MRLIKKIIAKMIDEFWAAIVVELVGFKSKMYSIKKLMAKIVIHKREWVSQLNLINSKMFYLMKKLLDATWK